MGFDSFTLDCFLAVAETGSFTQAAAKVWRTQSALSQQIAKLEAQLGTVLLQRGKRITLTADGEVLLGYAKQIMRLQHEALDRFRAPELEGEVRFGLPEDFASVYLSKVLVAFSQTHPRVLLNIECDLTLNLYERFRKQELDIVLVKMSKPEDFPNGTDVWSETLEWVGQDACFAQRPTEPIPLVLSPQPCVYRSRALKALEAGKRKWRIVFSSHSYASTIAAVKAGLGATVLPRNMVPPGLNIIRQAATTLPLADTHISLLKHNSINKAVNSLDDFVIASLRG